MASSSECSEECNRLVFEAVYESSVFKLRHVISTYSEDDVLASFSQCNEKGENPLVIAIKGENADLTDMFIVFLRYCQRFRLHSYHPVPLNAFDKLSHQIPIIQLIEHLFAGFSDITWLKFLAQVFIESTSFTRQDKIIALELIGALLNMDLPLHGHSAHSSDLGLQCWREAMKLRYFPAEGEPLLPKIPFVPIPSVASSVVFGCAVEVLYMEGLDLLEGHYKRNFFTVAPGVKLTCKKFMQRQALLVIRRVTSQSNSEYPSSLYLKSLLKFGKDLMYDIQSNLGYSAEIHQLITNTFLLILEQINGFDPKKIPRISFDVFVVTLLKMSLYFYQMLRQPSDSPGSRELTYANLLVPTRFFDTIANVFPQPEMISSVCGILFWNEIECEYGFWKKRYDLAKLVFCFVLVLESISSRLSSQEKQHLEDCYSNYIRNFFPDRTTTVLHAAVRETNPWLLLWNNFRVTTVENLKTTIKHLLKLGADPNAIDRFGQTPLHIFAGRQNIHLDKNVALFQALVDAGTHLDVAADDGETVLSILKNNLMQSDESSLIVHPYYESLLSTDVFPLSCFCARVIRHHEIQFDRLPLHLQTFVTRHSAKDLPQRDDHADNQGFKFNFHRSGIPGNPGFVRMGFNFGY